MALDTTAYPHDSLEQNLQDYPQQNPEESLFNLTQDALEVRLNQDNAAVALLKIAAIAHNALPTNDTNREQIF